MGSVPNCRQGALTRSAIRWFKCKLKPPKNEIEENMEGESGTELKVTKPADPRRKKVPPLLKNFYKKQQAIQSDREKDILGRNSKVNFTPGKMRKYLFSLIITEITP